MFNLNERTISELISDLKEGRYEQAARYSQFADLYQEWQIVLSPDFKGMEWQYADQQSYQHLDGSERTWGAKEKVQVYIERPAFGYFLAPNGVRHGVKQNTSFDQDLVLDQDCPQCPVDGFKNLLSSLEAIQKSWLKPTSEEREEIVINLETLYVGLGFAVSNTANVKVYIKNRDGEVLYILDVEKVWKKEQNLPSKQELENAAEALEKAAEAAKKAAEQSAQKVADKAAADALEKAEISELRVLLTARKQRAKNGSIAKASEVKRLKELCQKYPHIY